jgi:two-component system chemotaxis response regulator CheB
VDEAGDAALARGVIVIGASAGGLEALNQVVRGLPAYLPAAVLGVVHGPPGRAGSPRS